jgi:hypothetical protein
MLAFNDKDFVSDFLKLSKVVQNMKGGHTGVHADTQLRDLPNPLPLSNGKEDQRFFLPFGSLISVKFF